MELPTSRTDEMTIKPILEQVPISEYESVPIRFRLEWGPLFYRGRTDGSAKLLIIGQDLAADGNVARRVMVGTAGPCPEAR